MNHFDKKTAEILSEYLCDEIHSVNISLIHNRDKYFRHELVGTIPPPYNSREFLNNVVTESQTRLLLISFKQEGLDSKRYNTIIDLIKLLRDDIRYHGFLHENFDAVAAWQISVDLFIEDLISLDYLTEESTKLLTKRMDTVTI